MTGGESQLVIHAHLLHDRTDCPDHELPNMTGQQGEREGTLNSDSTPHLRDASNRIPGGTHHGGTDH